MWLKDSRPASELQRPEGSNTRTFGEWKKADGRIDGGGRREREEREAVQIQSG